MGPWEWCTAPAIHSSTGLSPLKTITTGVADDPASCSGSIARPNPQAAFSIPNIVTIYDMGEAGALPYIAMELVEGENLEQLIARRSAFSITLKLAYASKPAVPFTLRTNVASSTATSSPVT